MKFYCCHRCVCEQRCNSHIASCLMSFLLHATGETRFATNFIMLERLVKTKRELQKTVVDEKWEAWVMRGDQRVKAGAEACKAAVMDDRWFTAAETLVALGR